MLMIRENTCSVDSSTPFSEIEGDANADDLDNHLLDLYTSVRKYP
jgi:hypothetical protein